MDFLDVSVGKESACNAADTGDVGSTPGSGRSPGEGNGNPPQYSCLGNPMDRGGWQTTVQRVEESDTAERLRTCTYVYVCNLPGTLKTC